MPTAEPEPEATATEEPADDDAGTSDPTPTLEATSAPIIDPKPADDSEVYYIADSCDARFFTGFPPDQAWCSDDWAMATVDGFGVDLASYRLVGGISRQIAQGPVNGQIDITESLNLGLPVAVGEALCQQAAQTREFSADNCRPHSTASAASLAFVQAHLWDTPMDDLGTSGAIASIANVRTGLEYTPFLNRLVSWEVAGAADGCWLSGGISVRCAVDLRSLDGEIVDTVVVTTYPRGAVDATFDGFTGSYEVTEVTVGIGAAGINLDQWALAPQSYGPIRVGATLADVTGTLGFDVDIAEPTTASGSCVFATPIGFPGLFYVVTLSATSTNVADGTVEAIVATTPDFATAWGPRVGSTAEAVVVSLGEELSESPHRRSDDGRYFDVLDINDPDHIVRFESFDGATISQVRAGRVDAVRAAEGCG